MKYKIEKITGIEKRSLDPKIKHSFIVKSYRKHLFGLIRGWAPEGYSYLDTDFIQPQWAFEKYRFSTRKKAEAYILAQKEK